jgi:hypothetical protein
MDYIVVGTSRCEYQAWQIKLLHWSLKKVNQKGKLVVLLSGDYGHRHEAPDFSFLSDAIVIDQPDYAHLWQTANDDWWGGIPNKYRSVEWLCENNYFKEEDKLLFLDPDMLFTKAVDFDLEDNHIVGQDFIHYMPLKGWEDRDKDSLNTKGIMYPFALKFKTLKKFYKKYTEYCEQIRKKEGRWEAEMWGLDYAIKDSNIKVDLIQDIGTCTAWNDRERTILGSIMHYPNVIPDKEGSTLFFKQDHTFDQKKKYDLSKTISEAGNKMVTGVDQFRTDYIYYTKWDFENIFKFYNGSKGYIVFRPWPGGFNNIRMSLELAVCIAYLTNRKLVLTPEYNMYLLQGHSSMESFFDTSNLGVISISFDDFCKEKGLDTNYESVKAVSKVLDYDAVRHVINFEKIPVPNKFSKYRPILNKEDLYTDEEYLFLESNLLGVTHQTLFTSLDVEIKKLIAKYVHYRTDIFDLAWQFINKLGDKEYYSIHIRRNDFQYKELFIPCEQILENIKGIIPQGSKLYIATDHRDKEFFKPLSEHYQIFFYEDIKKEISIFTEFDINWVPIIEQFICTRGIKFIGNSHSTLSSYIYRMRGYMSDIEDKNYYLNTETFEQYNQVPFTADTQYKGNWFREYNDSWSFGNGSIFVSIASYCDSQIIDTLKSLYSEAIDPSRVYVGVNLQDTEEAYERLKQLNFPNLKIIFTPKEEAKGVVYARNRIKNELVGNEDYFLQVDSHSRFRQAWDAILIHQYNSIEEGKVILTTYPNHFDVPDYEKKYLDKPNNTPLRIRRFLQESSNNDNRHIAENLPTLEDYKVVETRWAAAGFLFTRREWLEEVKIPNNIRFNGEEDFQTFLSYLKGWNLRVTSLATVWHNYNFKTSDTDEPYREHNNKYFIDDTAIDLVNHFLFNETHTRTLDDLESYFNIKLKR